MGTVGTDIKCVRSALRAFYAGARVLRSNAERRRQAKPPDCAPLPRSASGTAATVFPNSHSVSVSPISVRDDVSACRTSPVAGSAPEFREGECLPHPCKGRGR